jgi:glycosyltransferase involved in cell wall biosynthesis
MVLYYGVDIDKFEAKKQYCKDDIVNFIFVGYDWIRKGLQYLIYAWKELNREYPIFMRKANLLIFGPDKYDSILNKIINNENNIKLMGKENPIKIYKKGDVFVFPSLEDGFGLVVLEAMASGLPVIVSENTGASELVNKNGFIVPIKDKNILKEYILYFFENHDEIKNMGVKSRKIAEENTWENFRNNYINLLNKLY